MLTLGIVLEALTGRAFPEVGQVITDAAVDSRLVIPGSLFVALPGEHADGHNYVTGAFERGAIVAVIEKDLPGAFDVLDLRGGAAPTLPSEIGLPLCLRVDSSLLALQAAAAHWRSRLPTRVIGVTGSVGKSTTKELIADILDERFRTLKNPGNQNNEIGLPLSLLRLSEAHERAVLEMGFYVPGEIALLCELARPAVGVITNISQVHLERAGNLQAIIDGKAELVESLPAGPGSAAILNFDDPLVRPMAARTPAEVMFYGLSPEADLWADEVESLGLEGVRFTLHYRGDHIHIRVPLLGRHSVHTALRAAAVGLTEGLRWDEIVHGLQATQSQLRLVAVQGPRGSLIIDDTYNAAPPSVIAALNLLGDLEGRHTAVLGDMLELGEYEEEGHRIVGMRAAGVVDELVTVGERARWIADEAGRSGLSRSRIVQLESSQAAVDYLLPRIGDGDVILVKGSRGMHLDLIVAGLESLS
ncbi:MAG: UDP-N-acetylmuramoyl-tripeptide--D-alanyl-D-alanine ligase [Anaerolineales bacterium]|nr:UDP-N-acetylmuramoyl-tripeptide--D-alanyl-D-alanine ligase [Anaerolineales bacterium]